MVTLKLEFVAVEDTGGVVLWGCPLPTADGVESRRQGVSAPNGALFTPAGDAACMLNLECV